MCSRGVTSPRVKATKSRKLEQQRFRPEVEQLETRALPSVTLGYPGNQTSYDGDPINVIFLAVDSAGGTVSLSATGLPAGLSVGSLGSSSGAISGNIASNADVGGPYIVTITGTAADGSTASQTFTWSLLQPTITFYSPGDQSNFDNDTVSISASAYENAGHTLTYSAMNLPTGLSINSSSGLISGTLTNASLYGPYSVTVTATDSAANLSATTTFNWAVSAIVTLANPGDQENQGLDSVNIPLTTTVSNGDTPTFSASGLPSGLSIVGGAITGTIAENDGDDYSDDVTITATDPVTGAESNPVNFVWQVQSDVIYHVINTNDAGNGDGNRGDLRYCVGQINAGNANDQYQIVSDLAGGSTVTLGSPLPTLDQNITISGAELTVSGNHNYRVFRIAADNTVNINNMIIAYGSTEGVGGGILNSGTANLYNVVMDHNFSGSGGGAICNTGGATLTVEDCYLEYNSSDSAGGAILNDGSTAYVQSDTVITWNSANIGGGIANRDEAVLTIDGGSQITWNTASASGGGIHNFDAEFTMSGATLDHNSSVGRGGGLYSNAVGYESSLTNVNITNNWTTDATRGQGGGIYLRGGDLDLVSGCYISGNHSSVTDGGDGIAWVPATSDLGGWSDSSNTILDDIQTF